MIDLKHLKLSGGGAIGQYYEGDERSVDVCRRIRLTFYLDLEKRFSFRQRLNNFARIWEKSQIWFLVTSLHRVDSFDKSANFPLH